MAYTVKAMPSERLRQLVADDYYRGHRHAVGGHVYTGVSTYDQYDAYTDRFHPTPIIRFGCAAPKKAAPKT
jgi:hypothetical protein